MRKEIQIALVAIVAVVILFFGLQFLKGMSLISANTYNIYVDDAKGLATSNPVCAGGYSVGIVKNVEYDYEHNGKVKVQVDLDKQMKVPQGTVAKVNSDLLGNVEVDLTLGQGTSYIQPGGEIASNNEAGIMSKAADMVPQLMQMLPKLDSILASVNTLLADPAIQGSLRNIETLTSQLNGSAKELNTLLAQMNKELPTTLHKADAALDNANTMMTKVNDIDLNATMSKVNATLANLESASKALNSKEGSLGLLMHDKTLYNNLNTTLKDADALLVNFREHPKRYVHFSVFGKKDKPETTATTEAAAK